MAIHRYITILLFGVTKVWQIWRINAISPNFIRQNIKILYISNGFQRQTLLIQIDFLANSPNFSHTKLLSFMVHTLTIVDIL